MTSITVAELEKKLKNVKMIDVREPEEFSEKIEGAENKPLGALIRDVSSGTYTLPKNKEIVCYCRSGGRGKIAADFLQAKGIKAKNLEGGFLAWKKNRT